MVVADIRLVGICIHRSLCMLGAHSTAAYEGAPFGGGGGGGVDGLSKSL